MVEVAVPRYFKPQPYEHQLNQFLIEVQDAVLDRTTCAGTIWPARASKEGRQGLRSRRQAECDVPAASQSWSVFCWSCWPDAATCWPAPERGSWTRRPGRRSALARPLQSCCRPGGAGRPTPVCSWACRTSGVTPNPAPTSSPVRGATVDGSTTWSPDPVQRPWSCAYLGMSPTLG